jgi:hypothetical protein
MRHLLTNSDLALFAVLVALALWVIVYPVHGFDPSAPAALAGALFGGAALLLGNWINRYNVSNAAEAELEHRREKLKTLLAAELVNVATSLIDAKRFVDAALTSLGAGGSVGGQQDMTWIMPPRPFSDRLDLELLILGIPAIDALVTLRSNLLKTGRAMESITEGRDSFGWLRVTALSRGLAHDMKVLAEALGHIAPERQFVMDGKPPELVISILKRIAAEPASEGSI